MGEGYIEVTVVATGDTAEALADFLFTEGAVGLLTEDAPSGGPGIVIRASFPGGVVIDPTVARLAQYQEALEAVGLSGEARPITVREIPTEDWGKTWQEHFTPLPVGRRLVIAPPWEVGPFPKDRLLIRIDPGMGFGTGHHATTRMCLEALEALIEQWAGPRKPGVLDVGTGTGILAITAAALGAERVVAIDTDAEACGAATKNFVLNGVAGRVQLMQGGVEALRSEMRFDLILANLDVKGLCGLFGAVLTHLAAGGRLVASGILVEEARGVAATARASGFGVIARRTDDEWLCLTLTPDR
ncbi:MAG: 50S ribosomal protein L11 methyltransferase [Candidatus Methylomirabilales bacterium]